MNKKDKEQIKYLMEVYGVDQEVIRMLYDLMPNELYDGIPAMLEDECHAF